MQTSLTTRFDPFLKADDASNVAVGNRYATRESATRRAQLAGSTTPPVTQDHDRVAVDLTWMSTYPSMTGR